jgi:hypothetical protein
MTTISILPEKTVANGTLYRAVAGEKESVGKTVGEALDALTEQLAEEESTTLVIIKNQHPDRFFTTEQQQKLELLMSRWREARDAGRTLSSEEQMELEALIAAELQGTERRVESVISELSK